MLTDNLITSLVFADSRQSLSYRAKEKCYKSFVLFFALKYIVQRIRNHFAVRSIARIGTRAYALVLIVRLEHLMHLFSAT